MGAFNDVERLFFVLVTPCSKSKRDPQRSMKVRRSTRVLSCGRFLYVVADPLVCVLPHKQVDYRLL